MTKIKTCGLFRERDIDYVNQYLPDYAGFVINYPKSHRSLSPEKAAALVRLLNPGIVAVGVIVDQPLEQAASLLEQGVVDVLQLHGSEDEDYIRALKVRTGRPVWKAFVVQSSDDLEQAKHSSADLVVLDSGKGSGVCLDWSLLSDFDRPYLLAGGLNPSNVVKAVRQLHPYGIDLSSGIETNGVKDKGKLSSVIASVRKEKERNR
jgi:phosphoribosylanthranilate isomerase